MVKCAAFCTNIIVKTGRVRGELRGMAPLGVGLTGQGPSCSLGDVSTVAPK
jgi:hypothetical protein